jgi:hypothetical protein
VGILDTAKDVITLVQKADNLELVKAGARVASGHHEDDGGEPSAQR